MSEPHRIAQRTLNLGQLDDHARQTAQSQWYVSARGGPSGAGRRNCVRSRDWFRIRSFVRVGSAILGRCRLCCSAVKTRCVRSHSKACSTAKRRGRRWHSDLIPTICGALAALEGYAACPFRFFGEQLLNLEPLNDLVLRNDARRRGSLLHQVLATIHEQLREEYQADDILLMNASDVDGCRGVGATVSREALDAEVKSRPLRGIDQSLREIERREIEAWAPAYAEQETSYRTAVAALRRATTPDASWKCGLDPESRSNARVGTRISSLDDSCRLNWQLGEERILLTGQIDRVDIGRIGQRDGVQYYRLQIRPRGQAPATTKSVRGVSCSCRCMHLAAEQLLLADQQALALATGYWNIRGKGFQNETRWLSAAARRSGAKPQSNRPIGKSCSPRSSHACRNSSRGFGRAIFRCTTRMSRIAHAAANSAPCVALRRCVASKSSGRSRSRRDPTRRHE